MCMLSAIHSISTSIHLILQISPILLWSISIYPPLIQKYQKYKIITKTINPLHQWHFYKATVKVINNSIEKCVNQSQSIQVVNTLPFIVDKQLREHVDKAKGVNATDEGVQDE